MARELPTLRPFASPSSASWSKTVTQRCTAKELAFGNDETGSATAVGLAVAAGFQLSTKHGAAKRPETGLSGAVEATWARRIMEIRKEEGARRTGRGYSQAAESMRV